MHLGDAVPCGTTHPTVELDCTGFAASLRLGDAFSLERETHPTAELTLISGPIIGIFTLGNESVNAGIRPILGPIA
jgi:hypothetical protein